MSQPIPCPVCDSASTAFDVVDFNKSCEEMRGKFLPLSGIPIYYYRCSACQFCFAPEFSSWQTEDYANHIYNEDYILVDPEYVDIRPQANAQGMISMLGAQKGQFRHLDYGGGSGLMSKLLRQEGWNSSSYDPFVNDDIDPASLGQFDLITAYEVFEHVPDVRPLIQRLSNLLAPQGIILFSTMTSDESIVPGQRLSWWYAAPRNGHISLFSKRSLVLLGEREHFKFGSFSSGFHAYWRNIPSWASHVLREA